MTPSVMEVAMAKGLLEPWPLTQIGLTRLLRDRGSVGKGR